MNLIEGLEACVVCGNGAIGTLLLDRGLPVTEMSNVKLAQAFRV